MKRDSEEESWQYINIQLFASSRISITYSAFFYFYCVVSRVESKLKVLYPRLLSCGVEGGLSFCRSWVIGFLMMDGGTPRHATPRWEVA